MSTFDSTTFGKISGRHGTAVASVSKVTGKNYLRVYTAPSNPKSAKQVAHRAKFAFVNKELSCMRNLFKITFGSAGGVGKGISLGFSEAVSGDYPNFTIDYSKLVISKGSVNISVQNNASVISGTTVQLTWDTTIGFQGDDNDTVSFVFLNPVSRVGILKQAVVTRGVGTTTIALPSVWVGHQVHSWIYFSAPDGRSNSDSQYISVINM